jgi:hypothetical protein
MTKHVDKRAEAEAQGSALPATETPNDADLSNPRKISELAKLLQLPKGTTATALVMASSTVVR